MNLSRGLPECWLCGQIDVASADYLDGRGRCRDREACDARVERHLMLARIYGVKAPLRPPARGYRQDQRIAWSSGSLMRAD